MSLCLYGVCVVLMLVVVFVCCCVWLCPCVVVCVPDVIRALFVFVFFVCCSRVGALWVCLVLMFLCVVAVCASSFVLNH